MSTITKPILLDETGQAIVAAIQALALSSGIVPAGGTGGQVLSKISGSDFDVNWTTLDADDVGAIAAPASPTSGQFLVYDGTAWIAQTIPSASGVSF